MSCGTYPDSASPGQEFAFHGTWSGGAVDVKLSPAWNDGMTDYPFSAATLAAIFVAIQDAISASSEVDSNVVTYGDVSYAIGCSGVVDLG